MPAPAGTALADAIVAVARELRGRDGRLDLALLTDGRVQAALEAGPRPPGAPHVLLCRLAIAVAGVVIDHWRDAHPDDHAPGLALDHADAWSRCPCAVHADAADAAARLAGDTARRAWQRQPGPPAWAARIAAWAAAAPKYGWPAVAALAHVDHVLDAARVHAVVAAAIARLCLERDETL